MIPLSEALSRLRHTGRIHLKGIRESVAASPVPSSLPMAELARKIIRQQWPLRNHPDTLRRAQARSLIRAHVMLLRKWGGVAPMPR
jgi:hypothetical protein